MKLKNAFTIVELLIAITIIAIIAAMLLPAIDAAKKKQLQQQRQQQHQNSSNPNSLQLGDAVYMDGMDVTGRVNAVYEGNYVDLLVKGTNGDVRTVERVNGALLKKVNSNKW